MARRIRDPAVERAVEEVRRIRERLAKLDELALKTRGARRREALKIVDEFHDGRISYGEALAKLRALAEARRP